VPGIVDSVLVDQLGVLPQMYLDNFHFPFYPDIIFDRGHCCEILLKKAKHILQMRSGSTPLIGI
jgi:hypothetical protein